MSPISTHHDAHDTGLDHDHHWARDMPGARHHAHGRGPTVADAASVPTPSSALHDDAIYG